MCHLFRKGFPPNLTDSTMEFLAIALDFIQDRCNRPTLPNFQVLPTGLEPVISAVKGRRPNQLDDGSKWHQ